MALVHPLFTSQTTTGFSAEIKPQGRADENGAIQVEQVGGAGTFEIIVQGRADANSPWAQVKTVDNTDTSGAANNTFLNTFKTYPEMRLSMDSISGATVNAWLME